MKSRRMVLAVCDIAGEHAFHTFAQKLLAESRVARETSTDRNLCNCALRLCRSFGSRAVPLLPCLHESAQHIVHERLVAAAVGPEPLQHVMVDADIDMVLRHGHAHSGL